MLVSSAVDISRGIPPRSHRDGTIFEWRCKLLVCECTDRFCAEICFSLWGEGEEIHEVREIGPPPLTFLLHNSVPTTLAFSPSQLPARIRFHFAVLPWGTSSALYPGTPRGFHPPSSPKTSLERRIKGSRYFLFVIFAPLIGRRAGLRMGEGAGGEERSLPGSTAIRNKS